ncbi:MAG: transporter [Streptococcus mitis]|nr:transporter [Streptococcus mitis]
MSSSEFISKIDYYCHKKESLFKQSKLKYAIRSMFAGAFLTFSTAEGSAANAEVTHRESAVASKTFFTC